MKWLIKSVCGRQRRRIGEERWTWGTGRLCRKGEGSRKRIQKKTRILTGIWEGLSEESKGRSFWLELKDCKESRMIKLGHGGSFLSCCRVKDFFSLWRRVFGRVWEKRNSIWSNETLYGRTVLKQVRAWNSRHLVNVYILLDGTCIHLWHQHTSWQYLCGIFWGVVSTPAKLFGI